MSFDRVGDISDRNPEDTASRLSDLRTIIGVLFVFYGVLLVVVGLFDSAEEIQKANGIRINIWIGLGMFVLGALFLLWVWLRPLRIDQSPSAAEQAGLDGGPP